MKEGFRLYLHHTAFGGNGLCTDLQPVISLARKAGRITLLGDAGVCVWVEEMREGRLARRLVMCTPRCIWFHSSIAEAGEERATVPKPCTYIHTRTLARTRTHTHTKPLLPMKSDWKREECKLYKRLVEVGITIAFTTMCVCVCLALHWSRTNMLSHRPFLALNLPLVAC